MVSSGNVAAEYSDENEDRLRIALEDVSSGNVAAEYSDEDEDHLRIAVELLFTE